MADNRTMVPNVTSNPSMAASLEDKMTIKMKQMMNEMKALVVTTPAPVKAVEEVCVTCGSNHNFNHCPLTRGGNDFPVFQDNIQQFQQTAAIGNFLQRNQPSNLASQMKPPGFNQPNVQNNQNRYQGTNSNFNQNRGTNFNQNRQNNQGAIYQAPPYQPPMNQPPVYQAPTSQIQGVSKTDFENYVKANDAVLKNVQNQGQNLQNQMANVTSLLTSLCDNFKNSVSTSNSGTLPSQTVTNPRQQINAITTRSGKTLEEPSTPFVPTPIISIPQKEPKQNPETSTEKVQNPNLENTAHVPPPKEEDSFFIEIPKPKAKKTVNLDPNSPNPNSYQSKLPYLERMKSRKQRALFTMPIYLRKNKEENFVMAISIIDFSKDDPFSGSTTNTLPPSSSPVKTSDNFEKFTDELAPLNSLPPGNDDSIHKKDIHEETFQVYSNPLFEFNDNFKSSNMNPLFEENDKDTEIKSSSSFTLTSPEESEFDAYLERDSIPPGIDLTLPSTLEVSSSNPTSPTLTGEKEKDNLSHGNLLTSKNQIFFSRPQEVEEIKENDDEVSSDFPIHTIVMPIRITFDNPIDFNAHFSKPKEFQKDLTVLFDSSESSILPSPLLDSDSPFTAELSASVTLITILYH
ncbi:hypothetical protein Tco_1354605 [Tanacetum coccineum]